MALKNNSLKMRYFKNLEYNKCIKTIIDELQGLKLDTNPCINLYRNYEKKYELTYEISEIKENNIHMSYELHNRKEVITKHITFNQDVAKKFTTNIDEIIDSNIYRFLGCMSLLYRIVEE